MYCNVKKGNRCKVFKEWKLRDFIFTTYSRQKWAIAEMN